MAKTHQIITIVVKGVYPFPLDMLRYDNCWPAGSDDARTIERSLKQHIEEGCNLSADERAGGGLEVKLYRAQEHRFPISQPTFARWRSFGWTVVRVEERDGESYDTSQVERRA